MPTRNQIASALAFMLVCLASGTSLSCKSTIPSPEQTTERSTEKLRKVISAEVADAGSREQMMKLVDQIETLQTRFNEDASTFVGKYQSINANYDAPRAAFDQLFSDFDADRTRSRSRILDLHFQLTALASDKEWGAIGKEEVKMYEATGEARTAQEELK